MILRRGIVLALLLGVASGCVTQEPLLLLPAAPNVHTVPEPELDTRVQVDPDSGRMLRQWQVLLQPSGRSVKHGFERGWYRDGTREFERAFVDGAETGMWRSWYANGVLRSEYEWATDERATPMRFWHANSVLSAEGPAVRGRREGHWTYWYESGTKREEGTYRGNARHGEWVVYRENGSVRSRGRYANDHRVGDWQHPPDPHQEVGAPAADADQ